jgi:hypothetical protein
MISSRISKRNKPRNPIARNLGAFRSQVVISKKRNSKKERKHEKKIIANQGD